MKKLILILTLALSLSGCAGGSLLFKSVNNPITKDTLYEVENGMIVAFAGLGVYKKSCRQGLIPSTCKAIVAQIQVYTRQLPPLVRALRGFVKNNDQVNALVVYNTIIGLVNDSKALAVANNVTVGGK